MKEIGISIYPDFFSKEDLKKQLDYAHKLGYKSAFTSIQLGSLGFENANPGISDIFYFTFDYCKKLNITLHVDINDTMLKYIGATADNLKPVKDLNIPILRLDSGFTGEDIAKMTNNKYGIIIEENASMLHFPQNRIETIKQMGNIKNYYACHNFFPRDNTGISYSDALKSAKLFKSYGVKVGIFIGSLYSSNELNAVGNSVCTIEEHRYKPSHIQAMELFVHNEYDYVMFGDSNPSKEELQAVARVAKNDCIDSIKSIYDLSHLEDDELTSSYCIELPVWLDKNLDKNTKDLLTKMVFVSRSDQPVDVIRATQSRELCKMPSYNPLFRHKYAITIDNDKANRYSGELQIMLKDLPATTYTNVIGMIKPYGYLLLELLKYGNFMFILKEE